MRPTINPSPNYLEVAAMSTELQSGKSPKDAVPSGAYGQELILDLHECDSSKFTRQDIREFCAELCELIGMEQCDLHFWDDVGVEKGEEQTDPKTKGTSAVQFILTSTVVIHTLDLMKVVYVNIFSCKTFDADV